MAADERGRSTASAAAPDPLEGRLLEGRYRIVRRIAKGGMAGVYEGLDTRLDRQVAIKVMHANMGDDEQFVSRFVREARAAARLSHPNVVAVYDQGEDQGTVYLVMEYVPGQTLRDLIREESPMRPARALALIEPVLAALASAHRAGLVHRDVKPENVLITQGGASTGTVVKVADFGLAKAVSADTQHTATGVLIGTVSYLSPEVVVHGRADERADVYAAGVVLYELLTGCKPHEGETQIQVAYKHVHHDVPPPSALVPGIPGYVDALVARATARDRDQRPADAGVLLHQVHRVIHAVNDGVLDDPELEADLRPLVVSAPLEVEVEADRDGLVDIEDPEQELDDILPFLVEHHTQEIQPEPPPVFAEPPPITRLPPARPDVPRAADQAPPRRSRRGPVLFVLALLLVVGLGVGAWWFGEGRYTTTPGVLGMNEAKALETLKDAGLSGEAGEPAYSETVPAGEVISSDPEPGERIVNGGTVTLVLSQGKERYQVPPLKGLNLDAAQDAILAAHLTYGKATERWHETVPAGVVLSSDPKAGSRQKPDTTVNVDVSKGRRPRTVKDWTGRSAARAEEQFERKGLVVAREEVHSDTVAAGLVVSQTPASGTLFKGDTVTLIVSKGPELVEVPNVVAQGVDSAKADLESRGFKVNIEESDNYLGLGFVFSQDPGSGQSIPKGSTITLYLI